MRKINICRGIMYCVLICFGLASLPHGHAQTTSGSLTADETWSGTISVTGDVTVPAGVTLTIAAGTTVRFSALNDDQGTGANGSRAELIVNGALVAQGTADQPVVLTSASADPQKGDWYGLRVVANAYDASLSLSHCTIEYSSLGLRVEADGFDATLSLADSIIQQSAGDGIHMTGENGAQLVLDVLGSTITGHNGHGVYAFKPDDNSRLSGRIVDSTIGNNGGHGIYLFKGGAASMRWISSATPSTTIRITGFI